MLSGPRAGGADALLNPRMPMHQLYFGLRRLLGGTALLRRVLLVMPVITPPSPPPFPPYKGSCVSLITYLPQETSLPVIAHCQLLTDPKIYSPSIETAFSNTNRPLITNPVISHCSYYFPLCDTTLISPFYLCSP